MMYWSDRTRMWMQPLSETAFPANAKSNRYSTVAVLAIGFEAGVLANRRRWSPAEATHHQCAGASTFRGAVSQIAELPEANE